MLLRHPAFGEKKGLVWEPNPVQWSQPVRILGGAAHGCLKEK